mmetsp:Transcript_137860/g.428396  ORF Transcript_137860/g.428396 Transcript_137860/m.428396 type:complete len:311 (+) Transcript_137860:83-1015(+)
MRATPRHATRRAAKLPAEKLLPRASSRRSHDQRRRFGVDTLLRVQDQGQQRGKGLRHYRRHQVPRAHDGGKAEVPRAPDVAHDVATRGPWPVRRDREVRLAAPLHGQEGLQVPDVVADRAVADAVVEDDLLAQLQERGHDGRGGPREVRTQRLGHRAGLVGAEPSGAPVHVQRVLHLRAVQVLAEDVSQGVEGVGVRHAEVVVEELPRHSLGPGEEPPHGGVLAKVPGHRRGLADLGQALLLALVRRLQQALVDDAGAEGHVADSGVLHGLVVEAVPDDDALEGDLLRVDAELVGNVRHVLAGVGLARDP